MKQPTRAQKRRGLLAFAALLAASLVLTGGVTAGAAAIVSLAWNAAIARPLDAPALTFFPAWGLCVALGVVAGGVRIALSERARRMKTM